MKECSREGKGREGKGVGGRGGGKVGSGGGFSDWYGRWGREREQGEDKG